MGRAITAAVLLTLAVLAAGCRASSDLESHEPRPRVALNRDRVERAALEERWSELAAYLATLDASLLGLEDQAELLYWRGAADHYLGRGPAAREAWRQALRKTSSPVLRARLEVALRNSLSLGVAPPPQPGQDWVVLVGVFALKKSADDLLAELNWKGIDAKVAPAAAGDPSSWRVYVGPFDETVAKSRQANLERHGLACHLRPYTSL